MDEQSNTNVNLQIVAERINLLHGDVSELKESLRDSMKEVASAVTKLVQMEERSIHSSKAIERAFEACDKIKEDHDKLADRVITLEKEAPRNKETSEWIKAALYGAIGLLSMFVAKQVGLI